MSHTTATNGVQASGMDGAGNAYVFDATTGFLTPTPLTSPNPELDGKFGYSVSVSGTTVVVGTPSESTGIGLAGAGRAYVFDATTWSLATTLTSPYAQSNGRFGYSVAVSGTTVVVGASGETADGQSQAGHAYSFDASAGFLTTTLSSANPQAGGNFGSSVAVSCTTVVVSAPNESGGGYPTAGHAFIFS